MKTELISIIIPCYNYGRFLRECLDSVVGQSYPQIEIIVVNDGSTDNTVEICDEYNIKCITQENGGLASARNTGIRKARGKYIMCLDADDILPRDSIENHMRLAKEKTIVQLGMLELGGRERALFPSENNLQGLIHGNSIYANAVFPKQEFFDVGGYDESDIIRSGYEDWDFWLRLMGNGCKLKVVSKIGLLYRIHESSMTHLTTHKNQAILNEYIINKNKHLLNEK